MGAPPPDVPCVKWSESVAALMPEIPLIYSQKLFKAVLVPADISLRYINRQREMPFLKI